MIIALPLLADQLQPENAVTEMLLRFVWHKAISKSRDVIFA